MSCIGITPFSKQEVEPKQFNILKTMSKTCFVSKLIKKRLVVELFCEESNSSDTVKKAIFAIGVSAAF